MILINEYRKNPKLLVDILAYNFNFQVVDTSFYFVDDKPYIMPSGDVFQSIKLSKNIEIGHCVSIDSDIFLLSINNRTFNFNLDDLNKYIRNYKLHLVNKD